MLDITYLFCVYSVLGWVTEVAFFFAKTGKFHKRGILRGAYCPLYGFSLAVCTALSDGMTFVGTLLVCGAVCTAFELICGIVFDRLLGRVMWDYTDRRLNVSGYICAEFAAIWAVAAALCVRVLNPLILAAPTAVKCGVCIALCALMIADMVSFVKIP